MVGELLFAKAVIEEKNKVIEQRDRTIRELTARLSGSEQYAEELRIALTELRRSEEEVRSEEREDVLSELILSLVGVMSSSTSRREPPTALRARVIALLQQRYGLQIIDETPDAIDPDLYQVVEVDYAEGGEWAIEILADGYKLGETVIRPALVKVTVGIDSLS